MFDFYSHLFDITLHFPSFSGNIYSMIASQIYSVFLFDKILIGASFFLSSYSNSLAFMHKPNIVLLSPTLSLIHLTRMRPKSA